MSERPATPRQLHVCKRIAMSSGQTFALPLTFAEAHKIITADSAIRDRRRARRARASPA